MFDVGFSELIVIGLVALIVIGPQRLPTVARTVGHLLGRLQRYVNDVKSDISREMQLEELKKLQEQVASQARDMEKQVNEQMSSVESDLNASIAQGIEEKAGAAPQNEMLAVSPNGTSFGASPEPTLSEPTPTADKPAA
ncbi:Sec-independent protein translocase protein TatB [Sulfurisoma sediminicola]|uniref:Sec-independent protein translocase protein TatB n=1 Tax=Sulfurisoma sediminicola TaxID=1381557 RepID=A0A497XBS5_9PROT|nr:Sec-independent protein translocase protein TatB [Sulfurisoma sediminicola]RLJ63719.1 Sec-independent protein translocase TatB [Sulfurisoma sediminicola]